LIKGFLELVSTLEKLSPNKDDFLIGVEACGPYGVTLSYFLRRREEEIVILPIFLKYLHPITYKAKSLLEIIPYLTLQERLSGLTFWTA